MEPPSRSRFLGCLLGGALGDALGYPIEFERSGAALLARYGSAPPARLRDASSRGLISDDTQMTLFTAEGLLRARRAGAPDPTPFLLAAYRRWYATQALPTAQKPPVAAEEAGSLVAEPRLHARRAPGNTCLSALAASFMGRPTPTVDEPPNHSKGCGAVMRAAPFGLAGPSREAAFRQARDAGVLTHGHPSGYLSGAYLAALIFDLSRGASLATSQRAADALLATEPGAEELQAIVARARAVADAGPPTLEQLESLGGGWTGEEALAIALACALTAGAGDEHHVAAALWRAAAHGGDSDSTASIAGNLLGAMHGEAALPAAWLSELELKDVIERVATELHAAFAREIALD